MRLRKLLWCCYDRGMHRFSRRFIGLCFVLATAWACAASSDIAEDDGACSIGAEQCQCTQGGVCDPGLECLSGLCVDPSSSSAGQGGATSNVGSGASGAGTTVGAGPSSGAGGDCAKEGCQAIDVLFAIDHSGSMSEEINALAASQAFTNVVNELAAVNCGDIAYRIGVTDDNTPQFVTPGAWGGTEPWFDSKTLNKMQIAQAFNGAGSQLFAGPETPVGCEHVLSNATTLLENDATGFVRENALLVLVLISDVDDYGAYDQVGGHSCGSIGCLAPAPALSELHQKLLTIKKGNAKGLAAIVVAGPKVNMGSNFCGQPCSCPGGSGDCGAFWGERLYSFTTLLNPNNAVTADICGGPAEVPTAIKLAFEGNIDLACKDFEPPK